MKATKQRSKDVKVSDCEIYRRVQIFFIFHFDIPVINNLSTIVLLEHLEGA